MKLGTIMVMAALLTATFATLPAAGEERDEHHRGSGTELVGQVTDSAYLKECGACHFAFQPQLLPKRSWEKIMGSLDQHFGDSAALDEATRSGILDFLVSNSAETSSSEISGKILASIGKAETPNRITDTQYFKRKHREVRAGVFKRKSIGTPSNCTGCHLTAEKGDFDEHKVRIPKN